MDKFNILKMKSNGGDVTLRANVGLKISSKITANGTSTNEDAFLKIQKSLSVRNDKLAEILNSKTFQPLFIDSNGPTSSIGTSSNICDENMQPQSNNEGTSGRILNGMANLTPPSIASHISAMNTNPKTPQNHMLARLQRDLDSPSAATRLRAMRALKSPSNGPYNQFDVPHEEQDIITEEERREYVPQTIQEVMKDVIVYVEVRFGDENRTASIKETIAEIGATVNDNFNKNTTHVIFSNGTQSTYNKAKQLNIPIVSILWIEACKRQLRLVDPSKYSIHNIEQYENPELYKKVKVKKFFQAESELKIKKKKPAAPLIKFKPIKIPKKAKDNITGMINEFRQRQVRNSSGIDYFSENFNVVDLFRESNDGNTKRSLNINAEATVTSQSRSNQTKPDSNKSETSNTDPVVSQALVKVPQTESPAVFKTPMKRKTMLPPSTNSLVRVTRRTSMLALSTPSVVHASISPNRQVQPEVITEITDANDNTTKNCSKAMEISPNVVSPPRVISNRRTIFTSSAMDLTNVEPSSSLPSTRKRNSIIPAKFKDFEVNTKKYLGKNSTDSNKSEKTNRRRTTFATSEMPTPSPIIVTNSTAKSNRRRTLNHSKPTTTNDSNAVSSLNEITEGIESNPIDFAPNEASSPMVANKDEVNGMGNLRRTLFPPSPLAVTPVNKINKTTNTSGKRRRTLLPPNEKDSNSLMVSTLKKATESNRRRTVFTPSHGSAPVESVALSMKTPNESQNRRRTCFATSQTAIDQSTPASKDKPSNGLNTVAQTAVTDCLTPQGHTLFEEFTKRLSFSSTNKRHTDRDISMFIIEQRLKNLNEIARLNRSVSEPDVNIEHIEKSISDRVIARSSPQLPIADNGNANQEASLPPPPKKRKLFNPTAYEEQVAMQSNECGDNNNEATVHPTDKLPSHKTKIPTLASHKKRLQQRRSSMDFRMEPPKPVKVYASIVKSNSPINYLAYSNMNRDQVNVINKAIETLGKFKIESNVTKKTTHLVTFDSKRTQKFLRAIIRGLWIVNYEWVTASLEAGNWLYEEPFENRSVSSAVSMCRAESQAFGSKYKIDLFGHIDPIYISTKCKCPALKELYTMCGGRVTNDRQLAKYIVTDKYKENVLQRCVHSDWILDSITVANCKNLSQYILKMVAPSSVPV